MKKQIVIVAALAFGLMACHKDALKGEGPVSSQPVAVSNFTGIKVNGATKVHVIKGAAFSVEKKGYTNLLPYLATTVRGSNLEIGFENVKSVRNDNTEVFITMPSLTNMYINGNSSFHIGAGFSEVQVNAEINGNGDIDIAAGNAAIFHTKINGNGEIRSFNFVAGKANHFINGNGLIETQVTQELSIKLNGSGKIYYKGDPTTVTTDITGTGKVYKL